MTDDVAKAIDDEHCLCGWLRVKIVSFGDIEERLPNEFTLGYVCPKCGLRWDVGFRKDAET
jgi:hypothetical protein